MTTAEANQRRQLSAGTSSGRYVSRRRGVHISAAEDRQLREYAKELRTVIDRRPRLDTETGEVLDAPLSETERAAMREAEAVIERGLKTYIEVGNALLTIRDGRLYRAEYGTFEDYCANALEHGSQIRLPYRRCCTGS